MYVYAPMTAMSERLNKTAKLYWKAQKQTSFQSIFTVVLYHVGDILLPFHITCSIVYTIQVHVQGDSYLYATRIKRNIILNLCCAVDVMISRDICLSDVLLESGVVIGQQLLSSNQWLQKIEFSLDNNCLPRISGYRKYIFHWLTKYHYITQNKRKYRIWIIAIVP